MGRDDGGRAVQAQSQNAGHPAPQGSSKNKVYEGGTPWSIAAVVAAVVGSLRMWSLVPDALERFAFGTCRAPSSQSQLSWSQVAIVVGAGLLSVVLAEYGVRREGNRWLSMIGSILGVSCILGGAFLAFTLLSPPLSCTP